MTSLRTIPVLLAVAVLAGCGGQHDAKHKGPLGSPDNPVAAKAEAESGDTGSEGKGAADPGYAKLVDKQKKASRPRSRFTPCNLVSRTQARAYLRTAVDTPVEAPLGPSCIYRASNGRALVSVAVKTQRFSAAVAELESASTIKVRAHRAACGRTGGPKLYVSLSRGRTLAVDGPCVTALKFATAAVSRLNG